MKAVVEIRLGGMRLPPPRYCSHYCSPRVVHPRLTRRSPLPPRARNLASSASLPRASSEFARNAPTARLARAAWSVSRSTSLKPALLAENAPIFVLHQLGSLTPSTR